MLFLYFFNFIPFLLLFGSFFLTFFVLILSYLSGTCTFYFADISGRNFVSSFGHFWAELFPPAYVPGRSYNKKEMVRTELIKFGEKTRTVSLNVRIAKAMRKSQVLSFRLKVSIELELRMSYRKTKKKNGFESSTRLPTGRVIIVYNSPSRCEIERLQEFERHLVGHFQIINCWVHIAHAQWDASVPYMYCVTPIPKREKCVNAWSPSIQLYNCQDFAPLLHKGIFAHFQLDRDTKRKGEVCLALSQRFSVTASSIASINRTHDTSDI